MMYDVWYDMIYDMIYDTWYDIWFDIYLTAIGLTPRGISKQLHTNNT